MLYVVGLGLCDGDIPVRGLKALESVEKAYAELYTNSIEYDFEALEEQTGTEIEVLDREGVENEDRVLEEAENRDIAFLVSGDPLAATTHQDIVFRARAKGIKTEVVHAPSVFTAVADTGLSLYKFGRTTTLTVQNGEVPESVFDAIEANRERGLHTLVLVDPEVDWEGINGKLDLPVEDVIFCYGLGTSSPGVKRGGVEELGEGFPGPVSIVVPGELSDNERERLEGER